MDLNTLIISMASMGGLGVLFSTGLSLANKRLHVEEDPRIALILNELPGANCGGCGYAGCSNFSDNLVKGNVVVSGCPVCDSDAVQEIAGILGVKAEAGKKLIARVLCQGGRFESARKAEYVGIQSCLAATMLNGGSKTCEYGCVGYGDCVNECTFDAMYLNENGLPVIIAERCTGCGKCAEVCPRDVIELHPESHKLFVLCNNHDKPKDARKLCIKACIGCGICVRAVDETGMTMENNLARIDYSIYGKEAVLPTDKCATGSLVIFSNNSQDNQLRAEG